ncbi:predicted protein [Botrytis cinerea T4]|uniref:Uncharacterized protein n=1 Tax=Botryotinia fuckeliana (strain T4) TaxID=999810 RepID=G2YZB9_BOTF4|nr:predicted protein [Botrytis cinerea T4]
MHYPHTTHSEALFLPLTPISPLPLSHSFSHVHSPLFRSAKKHPAHSSSPVIYSDSVFSHDIHTRLNLRLLYLSRPARYGVFGFDFDDPSLSERKKN